MRYLKERRDGRAVECTGLENQQTFAGFQGSNPRLSANALKSIFKMTIIIVHLSYLLINKFNFLMKEFYKNISDALAMLDGLEQDLNIRHLPQ